MASCTGGASTTSTGIIGKFCGWTPRLLSEDRGPPRRGRRVENGSANFEETSTSMINRRVVMVIFVLHVPMPSAFHEVPVSGVLVRLRKSRRIRGFLRSEWRRRRRRQGTSLDEGAPW